MYVLLKHICIKLECVIKMYTNTIFFLSITDIRARK